MLREVVASSMTQLESVMQEAERADNDLHSFNPIGVALICSTPAFPPNYLKASLDYR